jgi:hypothetical protein
MNIVALIADNMELIWAEGLNSRVASNWKEPRLVDATVCTTTDVLTPTVSYSISHEGLRG